MGAYSLGYNGHAKSCDCRTCGAYRQAAFAKQLKSIAQVARAAPDAVKLPTTVDQTVFVRAHYKRQPNHLRKYPQTRRMFADTLKRFVA
jgi:hypothetical protein